MNDFHKCKHLYSQTDFSNTDPIAEADLEVDENMIESANAPKTSLYFEK